MGTKREQARGVVRDWMNSNPLTVLFPGEADKLTDRITAALEAEDEVASALAELREMFPRGAVLSISTQQPPEFGITVFTPTGMVFKGKTLPKVLAQVRESQKEGK